MFRSIRNAFITGIIVILPLGVTIFVINLLIDKLGKPASRFFFGNLDVAAGSPADKALQALAVVIVFAIITFVGYGSRFVLGRVLLNAFELVQCDQILRQTHGHFSIRQ